jgi:pyridoxal phosphate enzyme (YggS family)
MHINKEAYQQLLDYTSKSNATLVAVSKTKPVEALRELYDLGQRHFGENYVQELVDKQAQLPADIHWHFIGHLQSNKVKYIAPFVHLIHGIDSVKLLREVNKQAVKFNRVIDVLLQVHIAREETKFGFDAEELTAVLEDLRNGAGEPLTNVQIRGLMGMASFSDNEELVRGEFKQLQQLFTEVKRYESGQIKMEILSMGMSGDYPLALNQGSNMVRIGSLIFGNR